MRKVKLGSIGIPKANRHPASDSIRGRGNIPRDMCHGQARRYIGDGHPTFNRNPYNWYIKPYYWVDDHPLLYGNNGSLDPSSYATYQASCQLPVFSHGCQVIGP